MRSYSVLFADDADERFNGFRRAVLPRLASAGISFEPLHHSPGLTPRPEYPGISVEERLEVAAEEGHYDIVITDLNFAPGQGGDTEGFDILREAHKASSATKLLLITAFSHDVEGRTALQIAEETGWQSAHWINMTGGPLDWQTVYTACELFCDAIDAERRAASARAVPDPFDVLVLEDVPTEPDGMVPRLRVQIGKKKGSKREDLTLAGDRALVLSTIIAGQGNVVSGKRILQVLNNFRTGGPSYQPLRPLEVGRLLETFGKITLLGETDKYKDTVGMCRRDNDILCLWQTTGEQPEARETDIVRYEGFQCFANVGFLSCPKKLLKRRIPDVFETRLKEDGDAHRGIIKEIRREVLKPLADVFGADFHTKTGLIRSLGRPGYAIAATVTYPDE